MSDGVTIKAEGVEKLLESLKSYELLKTEQVKKTLLESGMKVQAYAKEACAVDTGRLRSSISTNWSGSGRNRGHVEAPAKPDDGVGQPDGPPGLVVVTGTNVIYGRRIEFGFNDTDKLGRKYHQMAQPYLYPGLFMYEGEVKDELAKILGKID